MLMLWNWKKKKRSGPEKWEEKEGFLVPEGEIWQSFRQLSVIMLLVAVREGIDVGVVEERLGAVTPWETLMYAWGREKRDCLTNNISIPIFQLIHKCSQNIFIHSEVLVKYVDTFFLICIRHVISFLYSNRLQNIS